MNATVIKAAKDLLALGSAADEAISLFNAFRVQSTAAPVKANGKGKAEVKDRSEAMRRAWATRKRNAAKAAKAAAVLAADAAQAPTEEPTAVSA